MAAINQIHYNSNTANQTNNGSAAKLAATAGIVGAGVGTACGIIKKVPIKNTNGKINDAFTKSVYNRYVKNTTDETLKQFESQRLNIIQNIKGINTKEELKKLLSDNEEFVNEAFASSNKKNKFFAQFPLFSIKTRKKNILESIENAHKLRLDNISNAIIDCLNGTKGTLTKANSVSDELYRSIRKTKWTMKAKQIGKGACLGGILAGIATFITKKVIDFKKSQPKNNKNNSLNFKDKLINKTC